MSNPNGPQPGSTPNDTEELSGNPSPWHTGEAIPNVIDVRSSQYPTLSSIAGAANLPSIPGYFSNPPANPDNPYHAGSGGYSPEQSQIGRDIGAGGKDAHDQTLSIQTGGDAPDPYTDAYQQKIRIDTAQDDQFIPIDDRR